LERFNLRRLVKKTPRESGTLMSLVIKQMQFLQLGHGTLLHLRTLSELARLVQLQGFKRWKAPACVKGFWKAYDIVTSAHNKM
jgi:hypothetical protein